MAATPHPFTSSGMTGTARMIVALALALTVLAIVVLAGDRLGWPFDLAQNFRPHAIVAALLLALIALFVLDGAWRLLGLAPAALVLVTALVPAAGAPRSIASPPSPDFLRIKLAHANLWAGNREHARFVDWVRSEHPDILVVSELTPDWAGALRRLADILPYQRLTGSGDVGILAAWPWRDVEALPRQLAVVDLDTPAGALRVIGVHPPAPVTAAHAARRDAVIGLAAAQARGTPLPVIVAGDFNAAPWSRPMRSLVSTASLHYGPGAWDPTWPVGLPRPFGVAIDHVLAGNGCRVVDRWHGKRIGSDHWPVVARVHCPVPADPSPVVPLP
jgi:endonuclease/exonuclease/phosphatase (EEP) superfamily protein YafD